jgi:hypothetical protein
MQDLEEAFLLIESNKEKGLFSGPKPDELILLAEESLNLKFPRSYSLFLSEYGNGGIGSCDIYGLTKKSEKGFIIPGVPDGIWLTLKERTQRNLPKHFIIIAMTSDGYWYCLDTSQKNEHGECPVVICGLDITDETKEKVAEDFGEFLLEQTKQALED